jgi:hypothetical protein
LTVSLHVAVRPPETVVTVIVAVPRDTPRTEPIDETVAIAVLLLDQVISLLVAFDGRTVAANEELVLRFTVSVVLLSVTLVGTSITVILREAVYPPSAVRTVIVALPLATPETSPELFTVAIPVLLLDQVTVLLAAEDGCTFAVSCRVAPTFTEFVEEEMLTPVTLLFTVTAHVAVKEPSLVVHVTVALPVETPVITPEALTVATPELLVLYETRVFVAFVGATEGVSCDVCPAPIVTVVGDSVTPVTAIF